MRLNGLIKSCRSVLIPHTSMNAVNEAECDVQQTAF